MTKYQEYMMWRRLGLRAIMAFGVMKFGISFLFDYLVGDEND